MLISVCIPHYNRASYLIGVLDSIKVQDYSEIEIVISDDCSTDDSSSVIPTYLASLEKTHPIQTRYIRQEKNLGYDGNLRAALSGATGDYLFILGNDDCLADANTLSDLAAALAKLDYPDACFTNFFEYGFPGNVIRRARATAMLGSGPAVAVRTFRSFSYVGGVVFKRGAFQAHDTAKHDGSVYVQIYLAARIVASGGRLASVSDAIVAKDFKIEGSRANSYVDVLASQNRRLSRKTGGLDRVGEVACDAILPYVTNRRRYQILIFSQLLLFTYPFWLFTYRQNRVYRAALNLALGCFPTHLTRYVKRPIAVEALLVMLYVPMTLIGLLLPLALFGVLKSSAFKLSRSFLSPDRGNLSLAN